MQQRTLMMHSKFAEFAMMCQKGNQTMAPMGLLWHSVMLSGVVLVLWSHDLLQQVELTCRLLSRSAQG